MDFLTNQNIIFYILAYLLGSVPFGLILAKVFAGVDIKQSGSKSIGATNVLRVVKEKDPKLAKKLGLATVILDAVKVTFILLIAMAFGLSNETLWMIAVLGVLGHCYSIFLGLEGGKGVATGLGAYIVLIPFATIIGAIVWAICAKVLKISSLSSLIALIALLISANFIYDGLNIGSNVPMYLIAFIVFYKHIPNIVRLLKGQEKKVV
ncbi:glycerol-3-phosphate 1-O-acyltransferase PlsY [Arcobacter porcinus]|uniref:Glycerol-3-phosphate acyltransferase n=1 Tax=Arcobacter porcinus TaxID=1935204 RepID=A0A1C0B0U4_9BACT|nr:glycerol-3-phosphate 1-O-acyltransferase PlsY [Arcobacter porcinus]OCL88314.1 Glycerol-3-phosphate acyltransferase [Aliarcobacter thereius]OCL81683.1 Glycerol-3-phosphate acyltransferase [Arcobacter porcinus]OCL84524.1 Glycerol-3-phosphate acyltransferase [Arcobacter porcinus]OCL89066.1 Glycerol-3-phosphate acyltransferase [Arcobacter porcinus]OCL93492.1 Glycerol-3-phosphate acyltransferase [Arcobacter porcinus]